MNILVDPFYFCLAASMIWAPIVFVATKRICGAENAPLADKAWPFALTLAATPALLAPAAGALGISLRAEPPLPPMAGLTDLNQPATAISAAPAGAAQPAMEFDAFLQAGAALYFYGFLLLLALGVARLVGFSYRVRYAFDIDEPRLEAGLESWRRRMGLKRRLRYAFTDAVSSVCVHGFFRPVILMPMELLERVSVEDVVLMGAHEMAHVKRGDTWLFAFATFVKAVFWFNPFIYKISARMKLAAEKAADALVIARGVDRREYARCFVQGLRAAAGLAGNERALVPSFTPFDRRSRRERLDAILSQTGPTIFFSLPSRIGLVIAAAAAAGLAAAQAAFAVAPKAPVEALPQAPVEGEITFGYGEKSEKLGADRPSHEGVDIKAARGAPVRAAGDGKVIDATTRYKGSQAWGNVVVIDHGHGLVTRYAHLDSYIVKKGDAVKAGDTIGAVGSTGVVTGPHLHFEVLQDGLNIDPTPVIVAELLPTPKPAPAIKQTRSINIAPAPDIAPPPPSIEPAEPPVAPAPAPVDDDALAVVTIGGHPIKVFADIDRLEDIAVELEGLDFDFDFDFGEISAAQATALGALATARGFAALSEEDRNKIRIAQREAMAAAGKALRNADQARERAKRDIERAQARNEERRKELAERRAEQSRERAERARERAQEQAEREMERAQALAEQERERAQERAELARELAEHANDVESHRREMLKSREKALRDAKARLERELAAIERERAELEREKERESGRD